MTTSFKKLILSLSLLFCSTLWSADKSTITYKVITDASNSPYEYLDGKGSIIGFDVDLLKEIGKRKGFEITISHRPWKYIFDLLNQDADILMATVTITPERAELVDFTQPYIYPTRTAVMLPETYDTLNIQDFADIAFGDTLVMQHYMKNHPQIQFQTIVQPLDTPVRAAFAVKKGNNELRELLDSGFQELREDGTFLKIATEWFGEEIAKTL